MRIWHWIVLAGTLVLSACGALGQGAEVSGWPSVDLGATEVVEYKSTPERPLHLHVFQQDSSTPAGAVLFFHGGGYSSTRVPQFEHQARALAEVGITGIIVEYRVTAEGTSVDDAIADGVDAASYVRDNAADLGIDPELVALAGSSAGGNLAVRAQEVDRSGAALVLFNPAVDASHASALQDQAAIVFHSRQDTIIGFGSASGFCDAVENCTIDAFDEGDHGFFNNEPALTETTTSMIEFLTSRGW